MPHPINDPAGPEPGPTEPPPSGGRFEREIRLAIVMYGGTSLAIYMNGIAQELLQLVRATSPAATPAQSSSSTARVYRKLAHVLAGTPLGAITDEVLARPPRVRFVIDILSGTSAGGINAVMLAKALARNAGLGPLEDLWLREAGLERLINDRASAGPRYPYREPVRALFHGDRMFVELLEAMGRLGGDAAAPAEPLVHDLALIVTGTDLAGRPIDLQLADGVAQEYDHKHTFEFRLSWPQVDEFTSEHDPLLAFAARTTSSLPAVFEPSVVAHARALAGRDATERTPWSLLFRSLREEEREPHERHAFADGGYLDNKPFGHAIDRLAQAKVGVQVTRKLYYLEPRPQQIEPDAAPGPVPNALENTLQVFSLARYETIRADVERLVERNRLLDRVRTLGLGVLEDLQHAPPAPSLPPGSDLRDLTTAFGPTYGGYHRLRVATLTDQLAATLADASNVPATSDLRRAVRLVVQAWRYAHFRRDATTTHAAESAFLERFDVPYARRRAAFVLTKVDQLFDLDESVVRELEHVTPKATEIAAVVARFRRGEREAARSAWADHGDLLGVAKTLAQRALVALTSDAGQQEEEQSLEDALELLRPDLQRLREELRDLLVPTSEEDVQDEANRFLERHRAWIEALATRLEARQLRRIETADDAFSDLLELDVPPGLGSELRDLLQLYWARFAAFDRVRFPLIEATGVGEELSPVEVHRISPLDCHQYDGFDEGKLFGTRFATFGGFLDERWRAHDIRWGRIDGAERLITTLLGDDDDATRAALVNEAHQTVLRDAFPADGAAVAALSVTGDDGRVDQDATRHRTARFLARQAEDLDLDPRATARQLSRLVRTSRRLTDTLSTEGRLPGIVRNVVGVASFTAAELIDAAIPKTFRHLLVGYWANLLLLFGVALAAIGLVGPGLGGSGATFVRVGVVLGAVAIAVLLGRSLVWRALAPPGADMSARAAPWTRWLGAGAVLLGAFLFVGHAVLERPAAGSEARGLGPYPTSSLALAFAATPGDVACAVDDPRVGADCVAPAGAPVGAGVGRSRALVILDFGVVALYATLLASIGLLATRGRGRWLGLAGIALAVTAAGLDVAENVRLLRTLSLDYAEMTAGWLATTALLADAKFLAAFAATAVLLPTLSVHAPGALLRARLLRHVVVGTAAAGTASGVVGLALDLPGLLAWGVGALFLALIGIAWLLVLGAVGHPTPPTVDSDRSAAVHS